MTNENNKVWVKIIGWLVAGALMVGGWIYAGVMSGYTARIIRLEAETAILQSNDQAIFLQQARFDEMFKALSDKLDIIIEQHKAESKR